MDIRIVEPCPECGATPKEIFCNFANRCYIRCPECGYKQTWTGGRFGYSGPEEALHAWNEDMSRRAFSKALPCPFCGSDKLDMEQDEGSFIIRCTMCKCGTVRCNSRENALKAWNRRAQP